MSRTPEIEPILRVLADAGMTMQTMRERQPPRGSRHVVRVRNRIIRMCRDQGLPIIDIADFMHRERSTIRHSLERTKP